MKKLFPYTARKVIRGREYWFYRITWFENGKRRERYVPLPGAFGSREFSEKYWALRSGEIKPSAPARQTWRELITAYRSSRQYRSLADGTKKPYDRVIERILEKNADQPIKDLTRKKVREIHEKYAATPRAADHMIQVIRLLFNFARLELDWKVENPADGIALFGPSREFAPWPEWLQEAYVKACIDLGEDRALLAYHLGVGTGQRAGDLVSMEWDHFDGEFMAVAQDKTGTRLDVYCPARLRDFLAQVPRRGRHLFPKNIAEPISYSTLEKDFRRVREKLGKKAVGYSMHGWRYVAAVELAEAGCSDAEIQAVTGHKGLEMVKKYRRRANQRRLSRQAQQRRETVRTNGD